MKYFFLIICFAASVLQAADKPVRIKFKDKTELEGIVSTSINDTQGFTLRTKFGETHYNWNQVDINDLRQSNPELHQFYVQQSHGKATNANIVKIKLRDGTLLEGLVSTSPNDTQGFNLRTQYGRSHYEWTQVDLDHLRQSKPELYQFYLQQLQIDDIRTDQQIIQFLKGKFVFRSEANIALKNYGRVLDQVSAAMRTKDASSRTKKLADIVSNNKPMLLNLSLRCQTLFNTTRTRSIQALLVTFRSAIDSLARMDYTNFQYNYKFVQESLAAM